MDIILSVCLLITPGFMGRSTSPEGQSIGRNCMLLPLLQKEDVLLSLSR
jgi:hypothetical protein